jgi:hypothetical protein
VRPQVCATSDYGVVGGSRGSTSSISAT